MMSSVDKRSGGYTFLSSHDYFILLGGRGGPYQTIPPRTAFGAVFGRKIGAAAVYPQTYIPIVRDMNVGGGGDTQCGWYAS